MLLCKYCERPVYVQRGSCSYCGKPIKIDETDPPAEGMQPSGMIAAEYFPYEPKGSQTRIVNKITETLKGSQHIIMESGAGTGKTICSLAGALYHAKSNDMKVIYTSRTILQCDQVMKEIKAISKNASVSGISVVGRKKSCLLLNKMENFDDISDQGIAAICKNRRRNSDRGIGSGCCFYEHTEANLSKIEEFHKKEFPTSADAIKFCSDLKVCPYIARKRIIHKMDVVVAPYANILSESARDPLLKSMKCEKGNILLIVDEAHNLIPMAREQSSRQISLKDIDEAKEELTASGDRTIIKYITAKRFTDTVSELIKSVANEYFYAIGSYETDRREDEERLEYGIFRQRLEKRFSFTEDGLKYAIDRLISLGEEIADQFLDKESNKHSKTEELGLFLKDLLYSEENEFIKIIKTDSDEGTMLRLACAYPRDIITFVKSLRGGIHMSSTLDMRKYRMIMELSDKSVSILYELPPTSKKKRVMFVEDVTADYNELNNPEMKERIADYIVNLCNATEKNTMVCFTSYQWMNALMPRLENRINKTKYWETSRQQKMTAEQLNRFKEGRNGVFFSVMGGSVTEGIDFPGDQLSLVIIVGIPFPRNTKESKAIEEQYRDRFGITAHDAKTHALIKIKHAIGRLRTDEGVVVILDSRAELYKKDLSNLSLAPDSVKAVSKLLRSR